MNPTWLALAQGYAGVLGLAIFFLAPGFLLASACNFHSFRTRSPAEKFLWSICLSLPLTMQVCVLGGRFFSPRTILAVLVVFAAAALVLLMRTRAAAAGTKTSRSTRRVLALAGLLGLYLVFAVTDIQVGHHLYVSTVLSDWSVRVPMVAAAMRSGVPPVNGLSALDGHPASLRYFYFWYVVCADAARLLHIPARAALAASCVWAAWAILSVFFLALKHLLGVEHDLRQHCVFAFPVLAIMGLDLIPTLALFLSSKLHPYAEIEWWHQDRTPSFLSSAIYAPHHLAAFSCLLTGLLVISLLLRDSRLSQRGPGTGPVLFASLVAGICFASAAGCSILPTVIVAIVCLVWGIDLIRQKQMAAVAALCGSAVAALIVAHGFLQELQTKSGAVTGNFISLRWRNYDFVSGYQGKYHLLSHHAVINQSIAQTGVLAINLFDLGFFLFVLIHRMRQDRHRVLSAQDRAVWALVIGTAIPYLLLSSSSIASPNDLGVDAGLLLRLLLQMWAVPWVWQMWVRWRSGADLLAFEGSGWRRAGLAMATACFIIGLLGEMTQVAWERLYFPLVGSQTVRKQMDGLTTDGLSERLYNIRQAYRRLADVENDPSGIIQYNPIGPMQPAMTFYATHQIAAFDIGCGTGYGGDYKACQKLMPGLLALYGNTPAGFYLGRAGNDRQDDAAAHTATAEEASQTCRDLHLVALVAESTDSIWRRKDSWVWTMTPLVQNDTVRIFRCPDR